MFRIESLSPNVQVANLAGIREAAASNGWFRAFLAELQSLRLTAAS
jgi:hypothetical protein